MPRVCGGMRKTGSLYVLHARGHPKVESPSTRFVPLVVAHARAYVREYPRDARARRCDEMTRMHAPFDFASHASPPRIESLALAERALITPRDARRCKITGTVNESAVGS